MDHFDYSEVKQLFAKYREKFSPFFSPIEKDLAAEMGNKLGDVAQVSREIVDLVANLYAIQNPSPVPGGDGYDTVNIGGFSLKLKRADPNVPIGLGNATKAYARGGEARELYNPDVRDMEGKLERETFSFYQIAHRITHITETLPSLKSFTCPAIRIVRNHLIEHPEGKSSGVTRDTFSYSKNEGPCVKGLRVGEQAQHRDEGFKKNSDRFIANLTTTLQQALN